MTPESLESVKNPEASVRPPYEAIEDLIKAEYELSHAAHDSTFDVFEQASSAERIALEEFDEKCGAAQVESEEKGTEPPKMSALLDSIPNIPDDYKKAIVTCEQSEAKIQKLEDELEQYAPEKAEAVLQKARDLEARLDYDKLVAVAFGDKDEAGKSKRFNPLTLSPMNILSDAGEVIGTRKILQKNPELSYKDLGFADKSLTTLEKEWAEQGLLKEIPAETIEDDEGASHIPEFLEDTRELLQDVSTIRAKYGKYDREAKEKIRNTSLTLDAFKDATAVPDDIFELYSNRGIVANNALFDAVVKRIERQLGEIPASEIETDPGSDKYKELVHEARSIDAGEVFRNIEIDANLDSLPFDYDLKDLGILLISSVPASALASIKRIQFRPLTKEEDAEDNTLGVHRTSKELGGDEIVISDAKVEEDYRKFIELFGNSADAKELAAVSARSKMQHTIVHEFGHALHSVLPNAALMRWEENIVGDKTNITPYVKSRHESDHEHRYMEDFSDSMALFTTRPEELALTSPDRFAAMEEIFREYMPTYSKITEPFINSRLYSVKNIRERKGISEEEARATYLLHDH